MAELTSEQAKLMEVVVRLEGIFMPEATRQREAAFKRHAPPGQRLEQQHLRCAHYTSAEVALKIIESKRIWMRQTTCMADYREVQHGYDILRRYFMIEAKKNAFIATLNDCFPNAATDAISQFDKTWPSIMTNTFVTSLSEHVAIEDSLGRLSMWRAFGGQSARVAIVFSIPRVSVGALSLGIIFSPVAYLSDERAHAVVDEVIEKINANRDFLKTVGRDLFVRITFQMPVGAVTCLKHPGFEEEREWRAVFNPHLLRSVLVLPSSEVVSGIPQTVYKIPLDLNVSADLTDVDFPRIFDRLIIGPTQYGSAMLEAFVGALARAGVQDAHSKVLNSQIPIRT